ncbi:hypothetical protein GCM10010300_80400 [Streptomyces olivaceoviridis]|nr:hypothetical protein GCM10010300_80400 [Streptomyces olivaceoviridis]
MSSGKKKPLCVKSMVLRGRVRTDERASQRSAYCAVRLDSVRSDGAFSWCRVDMACLFPGTPARRTAGVPCDDGSKGAGGGQCRPHSRG